MTIPMCFCSHTIGFHDRPEVNPTKNQCAFPACDCPGFRQSISQYVARRRRRKYGTLRSNMIGMLVATRPPEDVVRWLKTWRKAGQQRQFKMEMKLYDDNIL